MDFTKELPFHEKFHLGEQDLFLERFIPEENDLYQTKKRERTPILFLHGAFSGSWMWSRYIPHFLKDGWKCYGMNLRGHYFSRVQDMTSLTFQDYLSDIQNVIKMIREDSGVNPILIGHSLGGILGQKIAEEGLVSGLIIIDSSASREVFREVPYQVPYEASANFQIPMLIPAPIREKTSIDETADEVAFQVKYLTSESSKVLGESSFAYGAKEGISIDGTRILCPVLVINAVNGPMDRKRGEITAKHLKGEYAGFDHTSHTGLLVGQRYPEVVEVILKWLNRALQ